MLLVINPEPELLDSSSKSQGETAPPCRWRRAGRIGPNTCEAVTWLSYDTNAPETRFVHVKAKPCAPDGGAAGRVYRRNNSPTHSSFHPNLHTSAATFDQVQSKSKIRRPNARNLLKYVFPAKLAEG